MFLIFPNHLFSTETFSRFHKLPFVLIEDRQILSYFKFHKHKILLQLTAMRHLAEELKNQGHQVLHIKLSPDHAESFEGPLLQEVKRLGVKKVKTFEIEDRSLQVRLEEFCSKAKLKIEYESSPMFLTSREEFSEHLQSVKRPLMRQFYQERRKKLKLLVDKSGEPVGGQWAFENLNSFRLSPEIRPPEPPRFSRHAFLDESKKIVEAHFAKHLGRCEDFWWPSNRSEALSWLEDFVTQRFQRFADYEDALPSHSTLVYHSALSPLLNLGLLTPHEVLLRVLEAAKKDQVAVQTLEHFIRQLVGWREFMRGMYHHFGHEMIYTNFWNHSRKLKSQWYEAKLGLPFADQTIQKALQKAYNHPIERLMVISNLMLLCEVDPLEAYRWSMEVYADASEWISLPSVFGLGQFADGGLIATRPYLCGSAYIRRLSSVPEGAWCDIMDGLYWSFIEKNAKELSKNPRTAVSLAPLHKLDKSHKERIFLAAEKFKNQVTEIPADLGSAGSL